MQVKIGNKKLVENIDYSYDNTTGVITFKEPLKKLGRKWWQFWKRKDKPVTILTTVQPIDAD
jgi:hypothetical protein